LGTHAHVPGIEPVQAQVEPVGHCPQEIVCGVGVGVGGHIFTPTIIGQAVPGIHIGLGVQVGLSIGVGVELLGTHTQPVLGKGVGCPTTIAPVQRPQVKPLEHL
jgi:hypothetical protein